MYPYITQASDVKTYTKALWASMNPTLRNKVLGFESDTKMFKLGDGITAWNSLPYAAAATPATAATFTANNTILNIGEIGYETDTGKFKIGNGSTAWNSLTYASAGGGDYYQFPVKFPYIDRELQKVRVVHSGTIKSITAKCDVGASELILDSCAATTGWTAGTDVTGIYLNSSTHLRASISGYGVGFYKTGTTVASATVYKTFSSFSFEDRQFLFDLYIPSITNITGVTVTFATSSGNYKLYTLTTQADGSSITTGINRFLVDYDLTSGSITGTYNASAITIMTIGVTLDSTSATIPTTNNSVGLVLSNMQFTYKLTAIDRLDATTNWAVSGDGASTLTLTTTAGEYKVGTGALKFNKAAGNVNATIRRTTAGFTSVDLTKKVIGFWIYIPDVSGVSGVVLRISDALAETNGRQYIKTKNYLGNALVTGFNYIEVHTDDPSYTVLGTGAITACIQAAIGLTTLSADTTLTGIIVDHLNYSCDATVDFFISTANGATRKIKNQNLLYTFNMLSPIIQTISSSLDATAISVAAGDYLVMSPVLGNFGSNCLFEIMVD